MTKTFLEKFNKYSPDETALKILSSITEYTVKVDKELRIISVNAHFPSYVQVSALAKIEGAIKEAYSLARMEIHPSFDGVPFEVGYMDHVFFEFSRLDALGNGFFTDAYIEKLDSSEISLEEGKTLSIALANGGKKLLISGECDKHLEQVIRDMFRVSLHVEFTGTTELDYLDLERMNLMPDIKMPVPEEVRISRIEEAADAVSNGLPKTEPPKAYFDAENAVIHSGGMTFDVSEIENVYNTIKDVDVIPVRDATVSAGNFTICGEVFGYQKKLTKKGDKCIVSFYLTDRDASVVVKMFYPVEKDEEYGKIADKKCIILKGNAKIDKFDGTPCVNANAIGLIKKIKRKDTAENKRVELHLHTYLSTMDSVFSVPDVIETAIRFGHKAVAITDHGNVQAFPEILAAYRKFKSKAKDAPDLKFLYGIEDYFVDDTAKAIYGEADADLENDTFCVFDIETTGLSARECQITEIGAVLYKNGEILDTFESFVNPHTEISENITELTGITNEMVADAPDISEVLPKFLEFSNGCVYVAHNASFDIGFIGVDADKLGIDFKPTYIDTVAVSRYANPDLNKHTLDAVGKYFDLGDFNHHRAFEDAHMLGLIFAKLVGKLTAEGIHTLEQMRETISSASDPKKLKTYHQIIIVKNLVGLKNLYKLVSFSYLNYFKRFPRIPKTVLTQYREGLIIGSACEAGELYQAVLSGKPWADLCEMAKFYDFLEIQPLGNNQFMIDKQIVPDRNALIDINKTIVKLGEELGIPVVATGDVHFNEPSDEIFRQILLAGQKYADADRHIPLYYRTTDEMLAEFDYLPPEKAYEIVVTNTNLIADMVEDILPVPDGSFPPHLDGAEEELTSNCYKLAHEMYGDPLPEIVESRLKRELESIISHGFAVLYVIARRLVKFSEENGYLVGSRGSVGSSFVATMGGISEVNPLAPHYRCTKCKYSEFFTDGSVGSGFDLPPKPCPKCGTEMLGDGHEIPFETFLGFHGDKSPDIDLNFSGDVQGKVHKYTEVLFGAENVFRAGTLGTVAEKNAYGYVKKYLDERSLTVNKAEEQRLTNGCVGVKRTTGQHPGGIIVVPKEYEVYDFTPVQHPADDPNSNIITTHFAFKYLHDTILKLDELGHDVPTKYKMMEKYTGLSVLDLPMYDPDVMELFISTKSLGVSPEDIGCDIGTFGLPEFGTKFVIQMIKDARPKNFSDLLQISGLSHGTDVWLGNAQDLIKNNICSISNVIATRDNIMVGLIQYGLENGTSFKIMEDVRKGRGLKPEYIEEMKKHNVPDWYIDSCQKIKYMFPKAHAAAYVMSALRLGWFKVHRPLEFYAGFLSCAPGGFEAEICCHGKTMVKNTIAEIEKKIKEKTATPKETDMMPTLQMVNEAYARGITFLKPSLTKSHAKYFLPEDGAVRVPFSAMAGLGESAANSIYEACQKGEILSVEDLRMKAEIGKGVVEIMRRNGVFDDVSETNQMMLFGNDFGVSQSANSSAEQKKKAPPKKAAPDKDAPEDSDSQISMF